MRADFRLNLPPIGSHPLRSYALFKPHYLTVPPVTEELLKALPVLVFAVFFSDDRKDILPAAMSVGIGFFYFGEHCHPRAEPDSGNVGLGSAARLVRQPDAWPVHHDHRRGTALRQKAKEAVLHRYLRTLYRFRNDARPVQPADPIRLQLTGRLFSHGIVCAVLCRPAYRPDKAAVPVILRKIFRNLANDL